MRNFLKKILKPFLFLGFVFFTTSSFAQANTVKGKVTTSQGAPLIGVSIIQKGTNNGTVTDFDGNYEISLKPGNNTLSISYLGFQTLEKKVKGGTTLNIQMQEDTEALDEVVVVGYGVQKKSDVSGAISQIKGEELEDNVIVNVGQALQGRAAGVFVSENSGEPGGGLSVNIRGINTIEGDSQPLYILDGIPLSLDTQAADGGQYNGVNPLSSLNPDDIESIEILKDASATAIYGSRGANGVILITTRQAEVGKVKIRGRIRTSVNDIGTPFDLLNATQYNQVRNEWLRLDRPTATDEEIEALDGYTPNPAINGEGTDFINSLFRTSILNNYSISLSGGSEQFRQLLSLNYTQQEGNIVNSKFDRANLRYNGSLDISDKWTLTSNLQLNYVRNQRVLTSARTGLTGVVFNAFRIDPNRGLFQVDGEGFLDEDEDGDFVANPVANAFNDNAVLQNKDAIIAFTNTYKINKNLVWTTRTGVTHRLSENEAFANKRSARGRRDNGRLQITNALRTNVTFESFLNYDKKFGKNHKFTGLLGVGYEDFTTERNLIRYIDFTFDDLGGDAVQLANQIGAYNSSKSNFTIQSAFSRLGYTFKDKYIFTFNVRADGTSKFINGEPWGYFPSAAVAWNVKKESFLRNIRALNQFRLRASYGITGNQGGVGPLSTQTLFNFERIALSDDVPRTTTNPANIANYELTWETSTAVNFGLDFGLFKNRIRGSVDYFNRTTTDLLNNLPIPSQTGFGRVAINRGEIETDGLEVELNARIIANPNFKWNTRLNWSTNRTIVTNFGSQQTFQGPNIGANFFNVPASQTEVGGELGLFFGYNILGLIQLDDLTDYENGDSSVRIGDDGEPAFVAAGINNRPGTWIFEDVNGDGQITIADRKVLGNPNPDFFFGFNNNFQIGNFTLSAFIQGSVGADILNLNKSFTGIGWSGANSTQEWYKNRWTLDNQHNDVDFPSGQATFAVNVPTSVNVEDGSYVRLKNVAVSYNIPNRKGKSNLTLRFTGTNLATWTNYSGPDPEVSTNAGALARGVDYSAYPRPKVYSIGVDFNF